MSAAVVPPTPALQLLLVEDEEADQVLFRMAVRRTALNIEVHHVFNGQEALDYLQPPAHLDTNPPPKLPHAVVLDLRMPGMDGFELLHRLKVSLLLKSLPVIVCSDLLTQGTEEKCKALGASLYFAKPFGAAGWTDLVRAIWEWLAQPPPALPLPAVEPLTRPPL